MSSSQDWIFTKEFLEDPTSPRFQKCSVKDSRMYQRKTIMFVEDLGNEMRCEKIVTATACVFFHRFYTFHSFKNQNRFNLAVASLFLASKAEEMMIKLKDIVIGYFRVRNPSHLPSESECKEMQKNVLLAERILLQTLGFDLAVAHPHNPLLLKLRELKNYIPEDKRKEMYETAISFVMDGYRTSLCLQYPPNQISYGAILMAAIQLSLHPVSTSAKSTVEQSWFDLLERERDIDELSMKDICRQLMDLYDDQDNSLKCFIADKVTALKNINLIVGQETLNAPPKPSPTGVSEAEASEPAPQTPLVSKVAPLAPSSYESLYQGGAEERPKSVTVTSFVKPLTPHHPRSNSLGVAPPDAPAPAPLDYSDQPVAQTPRPHPHLAATPTVEGTPFSSYPCTPNFDNCPPAHVLREHDYKYLEVKTQFVNGSACDDNSAPKRARIE